ncbi:hypothetical protein [Rhodococcoides fascians]|uniref:hypothetical protein n=1 Tax=Rhodococcoides fascians TaxID=1828 RepID=UPI00050BFD0E|nr:hypothetical protein [Rhodococcus fascians]
MSGEELAAIEARASAATEGPWTTESDPTGTCIYAIPLLAQGDGFVAQDLRSAPDAEFIAHAREDVPALLAAVRERDNTIARVRARIDSAERIAKALDFPRVVLIDTLRAALDPQETP